MFFRKDRVIKQVGKLVLLGVIIGFTPVAHAVDYKRGDFNQDGRIDFLDAWTILGFQFLGNEPPGDCQASADINNDCQVDVSDAIQLTNWLFLGSEAGLDPTQCISSDGGCIECAEYPPELCAQSPELVEDDRFGMGLGGNTVVNGIPGSTVAIKVDLRMYNLLPVSTWSAAIRLTNDAGLDGSIINVNVAPEGAPQLLSTQNEIICKINNANCSEAILGALAHFNSEGYVTCAPEECERGSQLLAEIILEIPIPLLGSTTYQLELIDSLTGSGQEIQTFIGPRAAGSSSVRPVRISHQIEVNGIQPTLEKTGELSFDLQGVDPDGWVWIEEGGDPIELAGEVLFKSQVKNLGGWDVSFDLEGTNAEFIGAGCVEIDCLKEPIREFLKADQVQSIQSQLLSPTSLTHRQRLDGSHELPFGTLYPLFGFGVQVDPLPVGIVGQVQLQFKNLENQRTGIFEKDLGDLISEGEQLTVHHRNVNVQTYTSLNPILPRSFQLHAELTRQLFKIENPSNGSLRIEVTGDLNPGNRRVLYRKGAPPSSTHFDNEFRRDFEGERHVLEVPVSQEDIWVLVITDPESEPVDLFARMTRSVSLISDSSVRSIGRGGNTSFTTVITGQGLEAVDLFRLVSPTGLNRLNGKVLDIQTDRAEVQFELNDDQELGFYRLEAESISELGLLDQFPDAIQITPAETGGSIEVDIQAPAEFRNGHVGIAELVVRNTGDQEASSILLEINASESTDALLFSLDGDKFNDSVHVLTSHPDGVPGVVAPQQEMRFDIYFLKETPGPAEIIVSKFNPSRLANSGLIDQGWTAPPGGDPEWQECFLSSYVLETDGWWHGFDELLSNECRDVRDSRRLEQDARNALASYVERLGCSEDLGEVIRMSHLQFPKEEVLFIPTAHAGMKVFGSLDPNEKDDQDTGEEVQFTLSNQYPQGWKQGATITPEETLFYTIHFQNKPCDEDELIDGECFRAPARVVVIEDVLEPEFDFCSIDLGSVNFGGGASFQLTPLQTYYNSCHVPRFFRTVVTSGGPENEPFDDYVVEVVASIYPTTRTIEWVFTTLDPTTCDDIQGEPDAYENCTLPQYPLINVGFLPPDDEDGNGTGSVSFSIKLDQAFYQEGPGDPPVPQNEATITFDPGENDPLITPMLVNTIVEDPPPAPAFLFPSDDHGTTFDLDVGFSWESVPEASSYRIELYWGTPQNPGANIFTERVTTSNFQPSQILAQNQDYFWNIVAINQYGESPSVQALFKTHPQPCFVRGDANADGKYDISDPITTLAYLFVDPSGLTCLASLNSNGDALIDISDVVFSLSHLFLGDQAPPAPSPNVANAYNPGLSCGLFSIPADSDWGCIEFRPCQQSCP